jgi:parallel beta-helix repeat protein
VDRQYSRNLGTGDGIELVMPSLTTDDGPVQNITQATRYDFVSHAIQDANDGDEIVVAAGIYMESIDFNGKAVTVRSEDPNDPNVVAGTVIDGGLKAVSFTSGEDSDSKLAGLTITGARQGVYCSTSSPTICNCRILDNIEAGIKLWETSNPTIVNCIIAGNGGDGIEMWAEKHGRAIPVNFAYIAWCIIAGNGGSGIYGGEPIVVNTIVYSNAVDPDAMQIDCDRATVSYSDVAGGFAGEGNIDADPDFARAGFWADPENPTLPAAPGGPATIWVHGDYHLSPDSPCIDAGDPALVLDSFRTDIDGQPRIIGERTDIGCDEVSHTTDIR